MYVHPMNVFVIESFFSFFLFFVLPMEIRNTKKICRKYPRTRKRGVMAQGPTNPTFSQGSCLVTYLNSVCIAQPSNLMHLRHCGNTEHVTDLQLLRTSIIHSEFGG